MRKSAIAVFILTFSAGCAVDQQKEIATYRQVIDAGVYGVLVPPLQPGEPVTLRRAMLLTSQNNENLNLSGEDYLQALIDKDRAFAAFLPTISLAPIYTVRDSGSNDSDADGDDAARGTRRTVFDAPIIGQQNLFNGFRDIAALRRSAQTIDQRRELLLDLQQTLLLDTAQAFYAVLRAERSVEVLRSSLAVQDERLRDVRGKRQAGLARPLDVAQTERRHRALRVSLLQAQRDVQNARTALAFLIAQPLTSNPLIDELPITRSTATADEIFSNALAKRRDLLAAEAAVAPRGRRSSRRWGSITRPSRSTSRISSRAEHAHRQRMERAVQRQSPDLLSRVDRSRRAHGMVATPTGQVG